MAQPRYNAALQEFIRDWRPNKGELGDRFIDAVRRLVAAIVSPPAGGAVEVETILTPAGGKVVLRLADYEVQLEPVAAHHLALSLVEGAASARVESWLVRFLQEELEIETEVSARVIKRFREYRIAELQAELDGELGRQTAGAAAEGAKP